MSKRMTREQLAEENGRLQRQQTLLSFAVNALVDGDKSDATERFSDGNGGKYTLRLFDATAPHGGYVLTTFAHPGQHDHTAVNYLDELPTRSRFTDPTELTRAIAVGRLVEARRAKNAR